MTVGAVLRRLRKAFGLTLEEMAERAGTDAANLSRIERGKQSYTPEALERFAEILGTTVSAIVLEAEGSQSQAIPRGGGGFPSEEQEMLDDYRRLQGTTRSLVRLMIAELAK